MDAIHQLREEVDAAHSGRRGRHAFDCECPFCRNTRSKQALIVELMLRFDPDLDYREVAKAVPCSVTTAWKVARRLGRTGDRRTAGRAGLHERWHVRRGKPDPDCPLCHAEKHRHSQT